MSPLELGICSILGTVVFSIVLAAASALILYATEYYER